MNDLDYVVELMKKGIEYPFILDFLDGASKRIRSQMGILYLKSNKKSIDNNIYNILSAGELIHNASLLHDDIIDNADLRRSVSTIGVQISPKISILSGDYLIAQAIDKILDINNNKVLKIFKNTIDKMCEAEFSQFFFRGKIPSEQEYIDICYGKTASLFSAILESCAVIADLDIKTARKLGMHYGLYFQIKNDLELKSACEDEKNEIYTAKTVLGIEKTLLLLDNCRQEVKNIMGVFPEKTYKQELEGLLEL